MPHIQHIWNLLLFLCASISHDASENLYQHISCHTVSKEIFPSHQLQIFFLIWLLAGFYHQMSFIFSVIITKVATTHFTNKVTLGGLPYHINIQIDQFVHSLSVLCKIIFPCELWSGQNSPFHHLVNSYVDQGIPCVWNFCHIGYI